MELGGSGSRGTTNTVSIRRADQGALEPSTYQSSAARTASFNPPGGSGSLGTCQLEVHGGSGSYQFQSAGRIREPWNDAHAQPRGLRRGVSIRRADQGALERRWSCSATRTSASFQSAGRIREPWNFCVRQIVAYGQDWNVSIRRADQGALERSDSRGGGRDDWRFNPPGGSGSLGTIAGQDLGLNGFVSIRRADQGALEPPPRAGALAELSEFQSAGRIREPWNTSWGCLTACQCCFNPPGGSGSLGTMVITDHAPPQFEFQSAGESFG